MKIAEFQARFGIRRRETVEGWLAKGYLAGSKPTADGEWDIPEPARPPYTQARAKSAMAIHKSIVKASLQRKSVCAALYQLSELEFQTYVTTLVNAGLLQVVMQDGIAYYYPTLTSEAYAKQLPKGERWLDIAITAALQGGTAIAIQAALTHLGAK